MNRSFKKRALCGLMAGFCTLYALQAGATPPAGTSTTEDPNAGNLGYHIMTEDEFLLDLNDEGYKLYMSLSPDGKVLAREVASSRCNGANQCSGLNACATDKNECAGKGTCKGTSKCAISDKNLAVKLVAKKMAEKRTQALQPEHK